MKPTAFVGAAPMRLTRSTFLGSARCPIHSSSPAGMPRRRYRWVLPTRMSADATAAVGSVKTETSGEENTFDFRLFFKSTAGKTLSPWHDIPLRPDSSKPFVFNFVNEIPRGTQAKMEIATDELSTPIKQDVKKGALRFYKYGPSLVNYGAIPQTWEDPGVVNEDLKAGGDGDPIDVTEIGSETMPFGAVYPVKVLGCLALLDEGEVDWKVIAINTSDPAADRLNDIADVEEVMPGVIDGVREWFRMYKTAEGKGENEYGYNGDAKGAGFTVKVIEETHQSWLDLKSGKISSDELSLK